MSFEGRFFVERQRRNSRIAVDALFNIETANAPTTRELAQQLFAEAASERKSLKHQKYHPELQPALAKLGAAK